MTAPTPQPGDAQVPAAIALKAEEVGVLKARLDSVSLFALAVLAGAFIAFGAIASTMVATGAADALPFGVTRILMGVVFSVGLILVVVGGAELFTGNNLMVMAWASGRIGLVSLLRAWTIVYVGNLVGSLGTALLAFLAGHHLMGAGAVGATILAIAEAKIALEPMQALVLGALCNVLVCLAVWLCLGARSTADKILAIVPPITVFVAAGFEHSVANMYQIPIALMVGAWAPETFWQAIGSTPSAHAVLSVNGFLANLVPVTIGNMIGGGVLVGGVYWFIYLRRRPGG
ncbi:MAG: formate transporter FocA [Alphaproteobacteria bacterium]|nr:formate transporter FocA [Alphaproteobacteria bacterium]